MKISEFSVKNYQFTLVVFLAVLSIGIFSLLKMPRGEDPEFESPSFSVIVVYPGTNPYDMEKLVVEPMERKINELENMNQVYTSMYDGIAAFRVEYQESEDPDTKYQELVREISGIRKDLPSDILDIRIQKFTPTDVNIYQWALVSVNLPYYQLQSLAEEFENRLSKVSALKNIDSWGYPKQKVAVELNLAKMATDKIPLNRVLGAIQSENLNIPGGSINIAQKKFNVKTSGEYKNLDEIKNTIVYTNGSKIVLLKDIADVGVKYENETHITRLNGHRCVFVTVCQKENQNIIDVSKKVQPIFDQFKADMPKTVDVVKVFDQPKSVNSRLTRFAKDFGIAILLVLITLIPLGLRASIIVMISIPLSLAIGLTFLYGFGFTINQLSIVGMIVALGILVDDSIVVVENIERFMRQGKSRKQAAIEATKQISLAVIGCTILLCFAFLPIAFLPDSSGKFIRSLPMSVIFTVMASMFVSLTIVPFLASVMLKNDHNPEGNAVMRLLKKGIKLSYSKLMDWSLNNPWATISGALAIFGGVMVLAKFYLGFSLFPSSEKPMFLINIETPVGSNLAATKNVAAFVEKELKQWPEIKYYSTNIGRGNPRIYYNEIPRSEQENYAQVFVQLEDDAENNRKKEIITLLRSKLSAFPNAKILVNNFEQGPPLNAPIAYRIMGENLDTMKIVAAKIENIIKENPATIYTTNPLKVLPTDLRVKINKEKAGILAINISDIDRAVRMGIAGLNLAKFRMAGQKEEININITVPNPEGVANYDVFKNIYVNNALGTAIPLNQLTEIELETSPNQIQHLNKDRYVMVSTFLKNGYNTSKVNGEIIEKLKAFPFPKGFSYKVSGEAENAEKSFGGIGVVVIITIFGMISILILEFGNFKSTLIVLSVIPLGIVGAILMLLLWGENMSFTAVVGFIALIGIEVKNSLLLVDYTNQLREEGMELEAAIKEAGEVRFVPILLTSLTAVGGLTPLVMEYSDLYSPLALVLIGGIISSTLLSRLVTPVMYKLLPPKVELKHLDNNIVNY
jgi:multidrug efflux pump subunit AcrB